MQLPRLGAAFPYFACLTEMETNALKVSPQYLLLVLYHSMIWYGVTAHHVHVHGPLQTNRESQRKHIHLPPKVVTTQATTSTYFT